MAKEEILPPALDVFVGENYELKVDVERKTLNRYCLTYCKIQDGFLTIQNSKGDSLEAELSNVVATYDGSCYRLHTVNDPAKKITVAFKKDAISEIKEREFGRRLHTQESILAKIKKVMEHLKG